MIRPPLKTGGRTLRDLTASLDVYQVDPRGILTEGEVSPSSGRCAAALPAFGFAISMVEAGKSTNTTSG